MIDKYEEEFGFIRHGKPVELKTPADVVDAICILQKIADKPESAHILQDEIYLEVLRAIAKQETTTDSFAMAILMARQAVRAEDIDFPRWYA